MSTIDSQLEAVIAEDAAARNAAVQTLLGQGYTFHGGEQWKPPLGEKPNFSLMDELRQQLADVSNEWDEYKQRVVKLEHAARRALRQRASMRLRLNASEARNAEMKSLIFRMASKASEVPGFPANLMREARLIIAQSTPATDEQGAE